MNPEVKSAWVAALRSGEYPQGWGYLNDEGKFCCLGVLCDLAVKAGIVTVVDGNGEWSAWYGNNEATGLPPFEVWQWANLGTNNPEVTVNGTRYGLTYVNDDLRLSFDEIADLIESQL